MGIPAEPKARQLAPEAVLVRVHVQLTRGQTVFSEVRGQGPKQDRAVPLTERDACHPPPEVLCAV